MSDLSFRTADRADVPVILDLMNGGAVEPGAVPESVDEGHWAAFEAIDADPRNELIVMERAGEVVATCQLTFIPSLIRGGAERLTVESVHVRADLRGQGLGRQLMEWVEQQARERGSGVIQLTSNRRRTEAHRFYARLGYQDSHVGFKKPL
ncbi:GNAT family N-acetyltransferase [Actinoplanes sp. RD1]|uniref:GNAT family N-acetyltransferase n=1 Tax=Actinoplanes sp. RD1 TaxID=3064538 RepID=UPI0027411EB2|nr:GNAT family N-acetyltransferase [Actinoplanes sp. RD1]